MIPRERVTHWKQHGVALILSGGSVRAMAHLGLYTRLTELGIRVKAVVGSSGGAIAASIIASHNPEKAIRMILNLHTRDLIRLVDPTRSGMKGIRAMRFLERLIGYTTLEDARIPLNINTTNLATGESIIHTHGPVRDIIRASIAIPGIFKPVSYNGKILIDGDVSNPYAYEHLPYPREEMLISTVKHIPLPDVETLKKHPTLVLIQAMNLISQPKEDAILKKAEGEGIIIINCSPGRIFTITPRTIRLAYQHGYACAKTLLPTS